MNQFLKKRIVQALLCTLAAASLLTGCGGGTETVDNSEIGDTYPINTNTKLTYWCVANPSVLTTAKDLGDTPFGEELKKRTGIEIEYIHPHQGQELEELNLLLASGELPDIIEYNWANYKGGPQTAINEGYIISLNDVIDKYSPNFKRQMEQFPEMQKMLKTDSGDYYAYPFIRGDDSLLVSYGIIIRNDWLSDLGLEIPETIDEWENALRMFKEQKNAAAPLTGNVKDFLNANAFVGAFGIGGSFYQEDGQVKYGPYEPEFKDFLTLMKKWYDEKLLDHNFMVLDSKTLDANVLNGNSGAVLGALGGGIGKWMAAAQEPGYDLAGAPYPVLNKGERAKFSRLTSAYPGAGSAAITTSCKNVELAARFLDYMYSEDGYMLNNFGIEHESYEMVDGYPTYTDTIMKNPDGLSVSAAMARYLRASHYGPFVQDKRYMEQYSELPQQQQAWKVWGDNDMKDHLLPHLFATEEELSELVRISNEVETYQDEMVIKFIIGAEPLEKFDEYREQLKTLGVEKMIKMKQDALNRYYER